MAGIDFGNMSCYLAVARNKGIEVLMNDYSLHATPSCISFGQTSRLMGFGARQQLNIHYKNTILNFKQLLGKDFTDQLVKLFNTLIPCEIIQGKNGEIGLKVMHLGEERVFSLEQALACLFTHLRQLLGKSLGRDVNECVVNVPYYFDEKQRLSLLTAGKVASLNIHIINDHAALAYNYGIYRGTSLPTAEEPPKIVAFIDCGHSCTQACLVAFNVGKAQILGAAHTLEVGGLHFDVLLRDHFVAHFKEKYQIDPSKNPRASFRLLDECEKLKKQMSANSQNIPFSIECFMNDVDVSGSMQRSQFEEMSQDLFAKIQSMLQKLIDETKIDIEHVADVELVGGSSRIPRIKHTIAEFFKREVRTTMNLDDAIARGCALRSAMSYPEYQMKGFILEDPYALTIENAKKSSEKFVEELKKIERDMQAADKRAAERSDAKNALEEFCFRMQHDFEDINACDGKVSEELRQSCLDECARVLEWLDCEADDLQKKQIESRHTQLEKHCEPARKKLFAVAEVKIEKSGAPSKDGETVQNGGENTQPTVKDTETTNFSVEKMDASNVVQDAKVEMNDAELD